jgi:CRP-like cAMP-binding protein
MATPKTLPRATTAHATGDRNRGDVRNSILLAVPAVERATLMKNLEFAEMASHSVLYEAGEPIKRAYFIDSGLASVLSVMADGKSVEVGLIGKEGFIGLPLMVGFSTSATQVVMQVAGSAYRMGSADFRETFSRYPELELSLGRYVHSLSFQAVQVAACNQLHEVQERLARLLLMSQDRLSGSVVPLTQESLAHMLGTRRASVTDAAGIFQSEGLITYRRGRVTIEDRKRLEDAACECYASMKSQTEKWAREAKRNDTLGF